MKRMKSRSAIIILLVAVLMTSSIMVSYGASASSKVSMTTYSDVIKSGKYAYCSTYSGIYRVNLNNNKVKRIVKTDPSWYMGPYSMKLYRGYIYYCTGDGVIVSLSRVKTNGKSNKRIGSITDYAIKGKTIYYTYIDYDFETDKEYTLHKKMSLIGKNKKISSVAVKSTKGKKSNVKGYRVKHVEKSNGKCTDYLVKKNKKKIKICSYSLDF